MKKFNFLIPHVIVILGFILLAFIYTKPIIDNKTLSQHDVIQSTGAAGEITKFHKQTGKYSLWTNGMFGGMPSYTIKGDFPNSFTSKFARGVTYLFPEPLNIILLLLVGFYIMLASLNFNPWLSALGAIGFAFSSYNFISLEAGHISKVLAIAYAPPIIAGAILLFRGKLLKGSLLFILFMILELYVNHVQITYYLFIALLVYGIVEFIIALTEKRIKQFLIGASIMLLVAVLTLGSMASRFWTTYEYSQYTIRGPSELKSNTESKGGLDKDYAFSWSYGVAETFTYLIPEVYGGKSQGSLDNKSETYKVVKKYYGAQAAKSITANEQLPLYWGAQPSTSGPAYMGAIICFLFIFSLFIVKNPLKWWILTVVVLFTMLAWGKNFNALSNLFFDNFPMYNKFRAVTMIHALVAMLMTFMGVWGVKALIENKIKNDEAVKYLKFTLIGIGALLLVFILFGSSLFSFEKRTEDALFTQATAVEGEEKQSTSDDYFVKSLEQMTNDKKVAEEIYESLLEDRASLLRKDAIRSTIFILLLVALLWLYLKNKINVQILYASLIVLVLVDMWGVTKRYLNNDDFVPRKKYQAEYEPTEADKRILSDPDPSFRVMNTAVSTFNDATTSYFHQSIGGYSAVKMRRYQDLIEKHISSGNMNVLNMLNAKYFIQSGEGGQVRAMVNPGALGNAWFINEVKWVESADEEINALKDFDPKNTAIIDKKFKEKVGEPSLSKDSVATIKLVSYAPDHLVYESNSASPQLAVFSEIYYNNELGWESFVDGKPHAHFRTDYVLRGMVIPAGKHKIEFKFEPKAFYTGEKIALTCSLLLFAGFAGIVFLKIKGKKAEDINL